MGFRIFVKNNWIGLARGQGDGVETVELPLLHRGGRPDKSGLRGEL